MMQAFSSKIWWEEKKLMLHWLHCHMCKTCLRYVVCKVSGRHKLGFRTETRRSWTTTGVQTSQLDTVWARPCHAMPHCQAIRCNTFLLGGRVWTQSGMKHRSCCSAGSKLVAINCMPLVSRVQGPRRQTVAKCRKNMKIQKKIKICQEFSGHAACSDKPILASKRLLLVAKYASRTLKA